MYAEVKGVRGRALGARAQGGGDEQEGTASEVVLHWRAPPFGVAVGFLSGNPKVFVKCARFYVHVHVQSTSRQVLLAGHGWSVP